MLQTKRSEAIPAAYARGQSKHFPTPESLTYVEAEKVAYSLGRRFSETLPEVARACCRHGGFSSSLVRVVSEVGLQLGLCGGSAEQVGEMLSGEVCFKGRFLMSLVSERWLTKTLPVLIGRARMRLVRLLYGP